MSTQELKIPKCIDIKFFRLLPPTYNISFLPLNGTYTDIDSKINFNKNNQIISEKPPDSNEDESSYNSENNFLSEGNLFSLDTYFGKIFTNEKLDGIITFNNISKNDLLLRDLQITLRTDEKNDNKIKDSADIMNIEFPKDGIALAPGKTYTVKFSKIIKFPSKYMIFIYLHTLSNIYNTIYLKQKNIAKENGKDYKIVNGNVEVTNTKKLTFEVCNPFIVYEKFHNYQMNLCLIQTKIKNNTIYPLTIVDIRLFVKNNDSINIPLMQTLQQINQNKKFYNKNNNLNDKNLAESKYLTMQTNEEINLVFKINDINIFENEEKFVLVIDWLNLFDTNLKKYFYEFGNTLNTYNDYYKIFVEEKPEKNIYLNESFKVVIKLETKNPNKNYFVSLSQEPLRDNDKSNDREVEIIDIVDKKIELNKNHISNNFVLICKSEILGNVYLPRLKFLLYEENKGSPNGNVYDALLYFNCIEKNND